MIKVTFQTGNGGVYWAVYEKFSLYSDGAYLLNNLMDDSGDRGPAAWIETPEDWKIMAAEEA